MLSRWNKWIFFPLSGFWEEFQAIKTFLGPKVIGHWLYYDDNTIKCPVSVILVWLIPPTENTEWNLASHEEKTIPLWMPKGEGAGPSAVALGLAGGTQCTCFHTRCLPIGCWPVSKKSKAGSAQGTGEQLFTCVYRNSCEGKAWVFSSIKYMSWLSYMLLFCQEKVRKMENQSSHCCFTYIQLKKNDPIKQSWRTFLLIIKGLSFSILTWLNKNDWVQLAPEQVNNCTTTIMPAKEI